MAYVVIATKEENLGFTTNQRERFLSRSFGFFNGNDYRTKSKDSCSSALYYC